MKGDTFPPAAAATGSICEDKRASWRCYCLYTGAALIVVLGLFLRTYTLDEQSVWNDEYVSVAYLNAPSWSAFQAGYKQHDQYMPPVYYALLYGWARFAGDSAWTLRLLSVIMASVSLCLVYILGRQLLGVKGALSAMILFAFSPQQIYHAQEIRCYPLVVLLGLLSAWTFLHMMRGGGPAWWVVNTAFTVLLVWTHLGGVLLACTWGTGALLWLRRHKARIAVWLAAQGLLMLPLWGIGALTMGHQTAMGAEKTAVLNPFMLLVALIAPFFKDSSYVMDALPNDYVVNAGLSAPWLVWGRGIVIGISLLLALLFAVSFLHLCVVLLKRLAAHFGMSRGGVFKEELEQTQGSFVPTGSLHTTGFLLLWFCVPAALLVIPVFMVNCSAIVPRYTIFSSPALHYLVILGAQRLHTQWPRRLLLSGMTICMMVLGVFSVFLPMRGNYLALGRLLAADQNNSPVILMGDSALLVSQVAYNGGPNEATMKQVYSIEEVQSRLEAAILATGRAWIVLEETHAFENADMPAAVERLLVDLGLCHTRTLISGPQVLVAYEVFSREGERDSAEGFSQNPK
ncbi:MAG TPA: glycosyltransferase family 39 protein [Candidatus Hydrogenedentes bacterium]|nr:glycosyltransferase family 39 protein [Candidatus Hydrogenedentota bacterium]